VGRSSPKCTRTELEFSEGHQTLPAVKSRAVTAWDASRPMAEGRIGPGTGKDGDVWGRGCP
jgi:hypothetical protein